MRLARACQDGNRELLPDIDEKTKDRLVKMLHELKIPLKDCLSWKIAFIEREAKRARDPVTFANMVMCWEDVKDFDIDAPRLADVGAPEVQLAQLLLRLTVHARLLKLMKEGASGQAELVLAAQALLNCAKNAKQDWPFLIGSAVTELRTLCEFFLLVTDPLKHSADIDTDVLQTVQTALHGALGLMKTAFAQTPHWSQLIAKASSICLAKETVMPAVRSAVASLSQDEVTLVKLEGILKDTPAWADALGQDTLTELITKTLEAARKLVDAGKAALASKVYAPLEELLPFLNHAHQLLENDAFKELATEVSSALSNQRCSDMQSTVDEMFAEYLVEEPLCSRASTTCRKRVTY